MKINFFSQSFSRIVRIIAIAAVLIQLSCAPSPDQIRQPSEEERQAKVLMQQGDLAAKKEDFATAADRYVSASELVSGEDAIEYKIIAAGLMLKAGQDKRAVELLNTIDSEKLDVELSAQYKFVRARLAYESGDLLGALALIDEKDIKVPSFEFYDFRSKLYLSEKMYLEAARDFVAAGSYLETPIDLAANQIKIWDAISRVSESRINFLMPPAPDEFGGWIELAYFVKQNSSNVKALISEIEKWKMRYPTHLASLYLIENLIAEYQNRFKIPTNIAVLLPLSGKYSAAASAIRDGILAGYFKDFRAERPEIVFYDTDNTLDSAATIYRQAVGDGADLVLGPLRKNILEDLAAVDNLPTPVLGLNYLPEYYEPKPNFIQFGLLPEDEAVQAAIYAYEDGYKNAVVLVPNTDWGQRQADAFANKLEELGGKVLEENYFDTKVNDFSRSIKALLNIDASGQRYRALVSTFGKKVEFEPRRRQDVDFIFLAATPRQARLVRPQFNFHLASRIPIYATSSIYSGVEDTKADQDLNGASFVDMPWVLGSDNNNDHIEMRAYWPNRMKRYQRLFAMGLDAYQLIPNLAAMITNSDIRKKSNTGILNVENNRIRRTLDIADFRRGKPQLRWKDAQ
ncbi:MAG: hypothetical protein D6B28_02210 [Gammaproteobacteria bacterium]|nr:MAG: hypothetical protein D6B28_02210 [Gammaproteobacteria bacterium]